MTDQQSLREAYERALDPERPEVDCIQLSVSGERDDFSIEFAPTRGPGLNVAGPYGDEVGLERLIEYAEDCALTYEYDDSSGFFGGYDYIVFVDFDADVDTALTHTEAVLEASDATFDDITNLKRRQLDNLGPILSWVDKKLGITENPA